MSKPYYIELDSDKKIRYDYSKFCQWAIDDYDIFSSYMLAQIKELPPIGSYKVTRWEQRPDMIAQELYGTPEMFWIVLLYNNLTSKIEIKLGDTLSYPSLNDIENLYFRLSSQQKLANKIG